MPITALSKVNKYTFTVGCYQWWHMIYFQCGTQGAEKHLNNQTCALAPELAVKWGFSAWKMSLKKQVQNKSKNKHVPPQLICRGRERLSMRPSAQLYEPRGQVFRGIQWWNDGVMMSVFTERSCPHSHIWESLHIVWTWEIPTALPGCCLEQQFDFNCSLLPTCRSCCPLLGSPLFLSLIYFFVGGAVI